MSANRIWGASRPECGCAFAATLSDKTYQGQIGFISPRAEFTPKTVETTDLRTDLVYRLRIVVTNADAALRQGMPVTIEVEAGQATGARAKGR